MKKLALKLEDLRVDSFSTTLNDNVRGTIFGEQCTCWTNCTCPGCPTCDHSCGGTCDASCNGTCGDSCAGCCCATADYTCAESCGGGCAVTEGVATSPGPMQECRFC